MMIARDGAASGSTGMPREGKGAFPFRSLVALAYPGAMLTKDRESRMPAEKIRPSEPAFAATRQPRIANEQRRRIFLLSPANASGLRGKLLLSDASESPLMERLRHRGAPLGEIFSFISGLYFRGKLAYARAYGEPPRRIPGVLVITASGGLISPDRELDLAQLREVVAGLVDPRESRYRMPLVRDALLLREQMGASCEVVLLGSIATSKYIEPLLEIFGERLMFPAEFVGRGDMSRGSLLLRCVRERLQLTYVQVAGAERRGLRPLKRERSRQCG
jgi:hypothetical protein